MESLRRMPGARVGVPGRDRAQSNVGASETEGRSLDHALRLNPGHVRARVARGSQDVFIQAEANFALWDMQVREHEMSEAVATARTLARDFPENVEVRTFLMDHDAIPPLSVSGAAAP